MAEFIPFSRPDITDAEIDAVTSVLRSGWLTTGAKARELEDALIEYTGARYAVALNSCTAALHLALEAFGVKAGDCVLTTPYTFAATGEVVRYLGATPILVDVDPVSGNIDPAQLAEAAMLLAEGRTPSGDTTLAPGTRKQITAAVEAGSRLAAIVPVHFAGLSCDMDPILETARRFGAPVIEDAAHALESSYRGRKVGCIGDATAFSFYATKNLTTGEGGALLTDDGDVAERVRMMSLHGISKDAWDRYTAEGSWRYEILEAGYKYNLTDIGAALGMAQFERIGDMRDRRLSVVMRYMESLPETCEYLEMPPTGPPESAHAWHLFVVRVRDGFAHTRADVIEHLRKREIGASVHFIPLHLHRYYRETYGLLRGDFPAAETLFDAAVSLPLYPTLADEEIDRVIEALSELGEG